MLASGRSIVAMAEAGSGLAAEIKGVGIAVPAGSGDAFARAIRRLAEDAAMRIRYGKEARRVALARWDKRAIIEALEGRLETLTARRALYRNGCTANWPRRDRQ
jgi:colanic acid biosynthesis glycosyl transferase WcaI